MSAMTAWSAVRMLARHELRSRWRSVIALGIASGIFFGGSLASVAVLVRADSAYDRMVSATDLADARVGTYNIFNDLKREKDVLARLSLVRGSILKRPDVVASQQLTAVYARRDTRNVQYIGIWAPRHQWDGLDTPVVTQGRMPTDTSVDEVMVNEEDAKANGLAIGDSVGVGIYRSEQVRNVRGGLGEPLAGHLDLTVVGIYRVADAGPGFGGIMAGPAFAARYDPTAAIGEILCLRLDPSLESPVFGTVQEQTIRLDRELSNRFGPGFYNYVDYVEPRQSPDPAIGPTEGVLRSGLGLLAVVIAVAGLVLTLQLSGRWSVLGRADHGVERALGMRTREQVLARLFAAMPAIVIAGLLAATGALLGGFLEPPGTLNRFEPHPGWLGQPGTSVFGALVVLVLLAAAVMLTRAAALRSSRIEADQARWRARSPGRVAPTSVLQFAAALVTSRGARGRAVRSRATVIGLTASLAMLVLVVTLGSRLTNLESTPSQWGWTADFGVAGESAALDRQLFGDNRVSDVDLVVDAPVHLLHKGAIVRTTGYGRARIKGSLTYTTSSGRLPEVDDEIALGPRLADEFGVHVGDKVVLVDLLGQKFTKTITGIVVVPTIESEPLGRNMIMTLGALREAAISRGYSNLLVRGVDDSAAAAVRAQLARSYDIEDPSAPSTIVALGKLSAPARLLLIVLLVGVLLLVAEHVGLLLRRRGTQYAIAASIGMTRRQLIAATSTSTVFTAAVSVLCGVPLGWALSRVILVEIGPRLGVGLAGPDALTSVLLAVAGVGVAVVLAVGLSIASLAGRSITDLHVSTVP